MIESLILICSVVLGVICSKLFLKNKHNSKLLLTFSGAFFFGNDCPRNSTTSIWSS